MSTATTDALDAIELTLAQPAPAAALVAAQSKTELAPNSPAGMMMAAMERGASLEQIEKMMDLQDRWEKKEAQKSYNAAFAAFKADNIRVVKGRVVTNGPLSGRSYAELHDVVDAVTPALSRHGLSASWKLTRDEKDWIEVTCTIKHTSGHSESVSMGGPPDTGGAKNALQARASTKSYLERYTLKAVCGVAEGGDDDDGAGGSPGGGDEQPRAKVPLHLLAAARDAAMNGWKALATYTRGLTEDERIALDPECDSLKAAARRADAQRQQAT